MWSGISSIGKDRKPSSSSSTSVSRPSSLRTALSLAMTPWSSCCRQRSTTRASPTSRSGTAKSANNLSRSRLRNVGPSKNPQPARTARRLDRTNLFPQSLANCSGAISWRPRPHKMRALQNGSRHRETLPRRLPERLPGSRVRSRATLLEQGGIFHCLPEKAVSRDALERHREHRRAQHPEGDDSIPLGCFPCLSLQGLAEL